MSTFCLNGEKKPAAPLELNAVPVFNTTDSRLRWRAEEDSGVLQR